MKISSILTRTFLLITIFRRKMGEKNNGSFLFDLNQIDRVDEPFSESKEREEKCSSKRECKKDRIIEDSLRDCKVNYEGKIAF